MNAVINLNKPKGKSSHDMVYFLRRLTGIRRVGHTGTLDPDATGVLPMCIGTATKAAEYLTGQEKSYRAQLVLGSSTDTLDATGNVTAAAPVGVSEGQVRQVIGEFIGKINQTPPMFSAIKIGGRKLYELAREGKVVERKSREVEIYDIEVVEMELEKKIVTIDVTCSKGTYIRTLCADIGERLGCLAHMGSLIRTRSGRFTLQDSYTVQQLEMLAKEGRLLEAATEVDMVFEEYPAITITAREEFKVRNGVPIIRTESQENERYRIYAQDGSFLCLSQCMDGRLKMLKSFWSEI